MTLRHFCTNCGATLRPGEAAFFVYNFDFAEPEGYKIFFDNVDIWQPMQ